MQQTHQTTIQKNAKQTDNKSAQQLQQKLIDKNGKQVNHINQQDINLPKTNDNNSTLLKSPHQQNQIYNQSNYKNSPYYSNLQLLNTMRYRQKQQKFENIKDKSILKWNNTQLIAIEQKKIQDNYQINTNQTTIKATNSDSNSYRNQFLTTHFTKYSNLSEYNRKPFSRQRQNNSQYESNFNNYNDLKSRINTSPLQRNCNDISFPEIQKHQQLTQEKQKLNQSSMEFDQQNASEGKNIRSDSNNIANIINNDSIVTTNNKQFSITNPSLYSENFIEQNKRFVDKNYRFYRASSNLQIKESNELYRQLEEDNDIFVSLSQVRSLKSHKNMSINKKPYTKAINEHGNIDYELYCQGIKQRLDILKNDKKNGEIKMILLNLKILKEINNFYQKNFNQLNPVQQNKMRNLMLQSKDALDLYDCMQDNQQ